MTFSTIAFAAVSGVVFYAGALAAQALGVPLYGDAIVGACGVLLPLAYRAKAV